MPWSVEAEFRFTEEERDEIRSLFEKIWQSPYRQYEAHVHAVRQCVSSENVFRRFAEFCSILQGRDRDRQPVVWIAGAPIDSEIPELGNDDPIGQKYVQKRTWVAECMLTALAELCGTPSIGYRNVNDGDVHQDIHPKRGMFSTQSQKARGAIGFHKDLANHYVRPDAVHMISMRNDSRNEVYTSFVRNADLIERCSPTLRELLRQPRFHTPFDDLSVVGDKELGEASLHPILDRLQNLRFFEGRTTGIDPEAEAAVAEVSNMLHDLKLPIFLPVGDMLITFNNHCIHAKDVGELKAPDELSRRWIMKTVNVDSIVPHLAHVVPGTNHLIDG
ncbi:hypothetical protein [Corynebacterium amycolatum]|uniref:hypothetical protein n=1 Tax=Corynebacterium amycolatum TaxID=43765 RepID=UPI000185BF44|nr:hypothetical protein [Corynebacterium amycolatum]EEB63417.1 hypothetical protein CORAM0001_2018 [Corynebacterium amycolatum SK46]